MNEIIFLIEESPEGGYIARALGVGVLPEAGDFDSLKRNIVDAVRCHYGDSPERPKVVRPHLMRDEVIPV